MKRVILASLIAAAAFVCLGIGVNGQAQRNGQSTAASGAPRGWYSVAIVTLKPDMVNEWREFQKTQTIPMLQRGGVKVRDVWQSGAPFGDGFTFGTVTPIDKFADYDLAPRPQRVLGADAARAYQEKLSHMIVSQRTMAVQDRVELSIAPAANAKLVGAILQDVTIVGGHAPQYEAYIKNDLLPVLKKGNVLGYTVSRTIFGGDANVYHTVQYFDSFADIDKGPVPQRVLGAEGAQALTAKAAPHIASISRTILRYVPDLSMRPKPAS
jgi:hypothetical protein